MILASSNPGDVILDPFLGSGTSAVVAKKLNRRYIGIEIDEQYALLAEKRLAKADTDTSIQGYQDGVSGNATVNPPGLEVNRSLRSVVPRARRRRRRGITSQPSNQHRSATSRR